MANKDPSTSGASGFEVPDGEYGLILPCKPEEFGEFLSGLLGKPQTISRTFQGAFEVAQPEIEGFYHLIKQRIEQQNDATVVQFSTRIVFDDNSSILLNSISDFHRYHEVRPIASVAVHMSWTLLVRFRDKPVQERQQIDVSIVSNAGGRSFHSIIFDEPLAGPIFFPHSSSGFINFRIQHTARTWGADIEALLSNHAKALLRTRSSWKDFLANHNEAIGVIVGSLFFLAAIGGAFVATTRFAAIQVSKIPAANAPVAAQLNYLTHAAATGVWPSFAIVLVGYLIASFVLSVVFLIWIASADLDNEPSFVLLTDRSEKLKAESQKKYRLKWLSAATGFAAAVIASLIANLIFVHFFVGTL